MAFHKVEGFKKDQREVEMSRNNFFVMFVVLFIFIAGCTQAETSAPTQTVKNKILFLLRYDQSADLDYMLKNELTVMTDSLKNAGYEVVLANPDGKPIVTRNFNITPDMTYADVKVDEYAGLVLPCLAVALERAENTEATKIVQEAASKGIPIAAQIGGVITLKEAGVLDGKQYTFPEDVDLAPKGTYAGTGVVQDTNIITSGMCPFMALNGMGTDGTPELMQKFIDELSQSQ
jgi:putative intracellular protease/amidase